MSMEFAQLPVTRYTDANSDFIRAAGPQGFQAYDYLFSSAHVNYLGIYTVTTRLAASQICMTEAEFLGYIEKFEAAGLVRYDADNCLIWAVSAALRSIGELKANPCKKPDNRIKMVNKAFSALPDRSPLKAAFFECYAQMLKLEGGSAAVAVAVKALTPSPVLAPAPAPAEDTDVRVDELDPNMISQWGYNDLLKMMTNLRGLDRDEYPVSTDARFNARVQRLLEELGAAGATECLDWSMRNRDMDLDETMSRVFPEEFTPAPADI